MDLKAPLTDKTFDPTTDDVPTPVRISAVAHYVQKEPLLIDKLRKQTVRVKKRSGAVSVFPLDIFEIALKLHQEGKDPLKVGKADILAVARMHLGVIVAPPLSRLPNSHLSDKSADIASRAVHVLLVDAIRLESQREGSNGDTVRQLKALVTELGFSGNPRTPAVVPYTLIQAAAQLADIHPKLANFRPQFDRVVAYYKQTITS